MATSATERRAAVLRAVVADYIASQEPVGSKALVERHNLQVSSATVRNDMAVLESEGYITQEHASSGRIPTEKGYRAFVDSLHDIKPLSAAERRAIVSFLEDGVDLEDVLRRSVHLLAQLTNQAAVIQVPTLRSSRVRHCEVVALGPTRLLLVLIMDNGRVDQRNVELEEPISAEDVSQLKNMLNRALQGKTVVEASEQVDRLAEEAPPELSSHSAQASKVLIETLVEQPADRIIMAGASNLTRGSRTMPARLPEVIEALEEQVIILKLMADLPDLGDVNVVIGEENQNEELHSTSVVTTSYGSLDHGPLGGLSVVGPTYMDYPGTIAKASAVARYVSRILAND